MSEAFFILMAAGALVLAVLAFGRRWERRLRAELQQALWAVQQAEAMRLRAQEERSLLVREVNHRAKNLLSIVQSMILLTQADDLPGFVAALKARVAALARANTLLSAGDATSAELRTILQQELEPYASDRIGLEGPRVLLAPRAVQPAAMIIHELATNSAKYGALAHGGQLRLQWSVGDGTLRMHWLERTGTSHTVPPRGHGFGTRVIDASAHQLGGSIERHWLPGGLVCTILLPARNLVAEPEATG